MMKVLKGEARLLTTTSQGDINLMKIVKTPQGWVVRHEKILINGR